MNQNSNPNSFITTLTWRKKIPQNHILRKIKEKINFDFIYAEVKDTYGINGNVSVPPPVILKMMLLLILYNVRSERELMDTIPLRLDWLWFLGYDLDIIVPNHSVLSKARARWGVKAFKAFFERIVLQCVREGLVEGRKLFIDSSLIEANASNNSVVDTQGLERYLEKGYRELEERLEGLTEGKKGKAK
jgi:transposase